MKTHKALRAFIIRAPLHFIALMLNKSHKRLARLIDLIS